MNIQDRLNAITNESDDKYELIVCKLSDGTIFKRIKALRDFETIRGTEVKKGEFGGIVNGEHNLSQEGSCWIFSGCTVTKSAKIEGDACILGTVMVCDNAEVKGSAMVCDNSIIKDNVSIYGTSEVYGASVIKDNATIKDNVRIRDCNIEGHAIICGKSEVSYSNFSGNIVIDNANLDGITIGGNDSTEWFVLDGIGKNQYNLKKEEMIK
jgi:NDP-sugar pyrophosphorylase family protein